MPTPLNPPFASLINDIVVAVNAQTVAIQNLEAQVAAQSDDLEIIANMQRYMAESFVGANPSLTGIWDGTDRYV